MPQLKYDLQRDERLPPCDGPKLNAFKDRHKPVEFIRLLSDPPTEDSGSGGHGHVFEAKINGNRFAIKVFKFYNVAQERTWLRSSWSNKVSDEILTYHSDPFFAECRAYGRIIENQGKSNRNEKLLAVPCYGYMALSAKAYDDVLCDKFGIQNWDRLPAEYSLSSSKKQPYRALVKKLIDSDCTLKNSKKMLRDLKALRKMGVYPRDIHSRNYKDGLLVDFSVAWTTPHWTLSILTGHQLVVRRNQDLAEFDYMMENHEKGLTVARATKNYAYCKKLRSHSEQT